MVVEWAEKGGKEERYFAVQVVVVGWEKFYAVQVELGLEQVQEWGTYCRH
jgi:hypothetical protein